MLEAYVQFLRLDGDELAAPIKDSKEIDERAFRVISAFWRIMQQAATAHQADLILLDLGPNLGAINRAALIASDYVVIPLSPDLFSLQGLRHLGPSVRRWRQQWQVRLLVILSYSIPCDLIAPSKPTSVGLLAFPKFIA